MFIVTVTIIRPRRLRGREQSLYPTLSRLVRVVELDLWLLCNFARLLMPVGGFPLLVVVESLYKIWCNQVSGGRMLGISALLFDPVCDARWSKRCCVEACVLWDNYHSSRMIV